uniref:Receptor-like serine/threonine-protein kinase n=1 Tax=Brassica napus TaxID=3708 RepID=Q43393_BRANA|nr:S-receptor kinase [Brassica napus]
MKGVRNIYHHSYTSFLLLFLVMILIHPALSIYINTLSSTESLTISSNRTLVSPGDVFELGFFETNSRWYLGMWYKKLPFRTYVWVANRDNPLSNSIGTLKISGNNLVILGHSNKSVWSTNLTRGIDRSTVVAELLANGNFVMRDSNNNDASQFLWQSFDYPTDTLLPEMKLGNDLKTGLNRFLTSWRSSDDPSSGEFLYELETGRLPEFYLSKGIFPAYRSGPWNGIRFSGIPDDQKLSYLVYNFTENSEEVVYTFRMTNNSIYSKLTVSLSGYFERQTWNASLGMWNVSWSLPLPSQCDTYRRCGPYAYCDVSTSPICNCIQGFNPSNVQQWDQRSWSGGCIRRTRLSCSGDGFTRMENMELPETTMAIVDRSIGVKECKKRCLSDCNCTAFANADVQNGGTGCIIWAGELEDIRNYAADGQDLYVRLAAADLVKRRNANGQIISLTVGVSVLLLLIMFCLWKRKQKRANANATSIANRQRNQNLPMNGMVLSSKREFLEEKKIEELELPLIELETVVKATENFSNCNKLGQGGFGIVYKGRLLDGQEIAVKRLSKTSVQGTDEFMNEVTLIARLQHINLVQIIGCCIEADEKMLVYEYLENLSLDSYLFGKTRRSKLNWKERFDIINGVARGLLYLHQDSRFRIIHRDLKVSNILLDKNMTPKISDFGMARIFARDETEANTVKVVGTYGYMSPEYAMHEIFSEKSDVFSFGVIVLEIVSGKKNSYNLNYKNNLLSYAWSQWEEGRALEIIDPVIVDSLPSTFQPQEVLKCIQIGLLCVQELAEHRPTMSSVVWMLGSEAKEIPQPKQPGHCIGRSPYDLDPSSSSQCDDDESWTVNQYTCSLVDAR